MSKFRIDSMRGLARQMEFAPRGARSAQVTAAEALLRDIDPAKAYPVELIIYRITGYRPKQAGEDLLTGLALQHDLGLLIEQVSRSLNLRADALAEPVLSIDDVCARFGVTSKTIQRWRRRGLAARRFIFADGKCRVGFLLGSVERFFAAHRDQVAHGGNFSLVGDSELQILIGHARRLAERCGCCESEIARRIGRRLGRSSATILHTLRKWDETHREQAILPRASAPLDARERAAVLEGIDRGLSLTVLARRLGRGRSAVHRIILDERVARLGRHKIKFIDDPLYHQPNAVEVMEAIGRSESLADPSAAEQLRVPRDLPPYLQDLYRTPLLSAGRERALFLKFNYHKFEFFRARRKLDPQLALSGDLAVLERCLHQATEVKKAIVQANLRLVVSIARRHWRPGLNLMELVSDGNLTLMRAVEGFDIHRGNRFSTYATLALMKGFARSVPRMQASEVGGAADERQLSRVPDCREGLPGDRVMARDDLRHLLSYLSQRERRVVSVYYGLEGAAGPATYEQVSRRLGLSKQRVRQIERSAMSKLRAAAGD